MNMVESKYRIAEFGDKIIVKSFLYILIPGIILPWIIMSVLIIAKIFNDYIPVQILGKIGGYGPEYVNNDMGIMTVYVVVLGMTLHFIGVSLAWFGRGKVEVLGSYNLDSEIDSTIKNILNSMIIIIFTFSSLGLSIYKIWEDFFK